MNTRAEVCWSSLAAILSKTPEKYTPNDQLALEHFNDKLAFGRDQLEEFAKEEVLVYNQTLVDRLNGLVSTFPAIKNKIETWLSDPAVPKIVRHELKTTASLLRHYDGLCKRIVNMQEENLRWRAKNRVPCFKETELKVPPICLTVPEKTLYKQTALNGLGSLTDPGEKKKAARKIVRKACGLPKKGEILDRSYKKSREDFVERTRDKKPQDSEFLSEYKKYRRYDDSSDEDDLSGPLKQLSIIESKGNQQKQKKTVTFK